MVEIDIQIKLAWKVKFRGTRYGMRILMEHGHAVYFAYHHNVRFFLLYYLGRSLMNQLW